MKHSEIARWRSFFDFFFEIEKKGGKKFMILPMALSIIIIMKRENPVGISQSKNSQNLKAIKK